ncbi:MAG: hypothetical protein E6R07_08725 [Nevskiaceae bacterium]|nr:MAG: hypothetical protein E6R07_08725 [Nevskiaceae bacterium]
METPGGIVLGGAQMSSQSPLSRRNFLWLNTSLLGALAPTLASASARNSSSETLGLLTSGHSQQSLFDDSRNIKVAEAGNTLPQAIGGGTSAISNLDRMRSLTGSFQDSELLLAGHSRASDGAQGLFVHNPADTSSADNGGTVVVDAAGRRWHRVYSGAVDVRWFGAKGDGANDDTAAIQAALNAGENIYLPPGIYYASNLTVPFRRRIFGAGKRQTQIVQLESASGYLMTINTGSSPANYLGGDITDGQFIFEDIGFVSASNNGCLAIRNSVCSMMTLSRVRIVNAVATSVRNPGGGRPWALNPAPGTVGILMDNSSYSGSYVNCMDAIEVRGFDIGIRLQNNVTQPKLNNSWIINCRTGISLNGVSGYCGYSSYIESGIPGAIGYSYGGITGHVMIFGGGIEITKDGGFAHNYESDAKLSDFELHGINYNIFGDGGALVGRKHNGALPSNFLEFGHYSNANSPHSSLVRTNPNAFLQFYNNMRIGGSGLGNGQITLGRGDSDAADHVISHDGSYNLKIKIYGGGLQIQDQTGTPRLQLDPNNRGLTPGNDSTQALGNASRRWAVVYSTTGSINTSDISEKTLAPEGINDQLIDAFMAIQPRLFQWNDAIAEKGRGGARWHMGYVAQELQGELQKRGIDPARYAIWCRDEIQAPVADENGTAASWKGTGEYRQGLRYEQFIALVDAASRRKIAALDARISALETALNRTT